MSTRGRGAWATAALLLLASRGVAGQPVVETPPPPPASPPLIAPESPQAPAPESPPPPAAPAPSLVTPVAPVALPPPTVAAAPPSPAAAPLFERPLFSVAVGMGVSFDDTGLSPRRTAAIPSFFGMGGFGDGFIGIDFAVFASTASGRYRAPDQPVDRLAADALVVVRPACHGVPPDVTSWPLRLLRTIAVEVGAGYERDGRGAAAEHRVGTRIGGRIELPLTPARDPSQLRLRIAARRLYAGAKSGGAADLPIKDSTAELYGALAVVF